MCRYVRPLEEEVVAEVATLSSNCLDSFDTAE